MIIIDAGHGGLVGGIYTTPGKRHTFGAFTLHEGVLNRYQAFALSYRLDLLKIPNQILAPENEDVSLYTRAKRANEIHAQHKNAFLISIHSNAATHPQAHGWEIWTSQGETKSDQYAQVFGRHFEAMNPDVKVRWGLVGRKYDRESNFYILAKTNCPAVLTEDLFMTNTEDFMKLTDLDFVLRKLVSYKADAILEIYEKLNK